MEGVVLVDVRSGALVFTRSFTDAFDLRHPRTERMNLSALLFALLSFADNSLHSEVDASIQQRNAPSISAFTTPLERIVFAQTPSKKLFVALFTVPTLDADVAKSVVRRLAYNYEHGNSLENRIAVVLNQGPRLFRDALSRSIEEQVDELLENFVTQLCSCSNGSSDPKPPFILFYFSDLMLYKKLREHTETQSDDGCASGFSSAPTTTTPASTGPLGALGFRSPLALGSPLSTVNPRNASMTNADSGANATPTRLEPTQTQSSLSFRSMYTSTRSLFPSPAGRATPSDSTRQQQRGNRNKPKKKKNAVMNHAEPQVFQRVVQFAGANSQTAQQCPESDSGCVVGVGSADAIAYVVVPFVKEVVPLFFAGVPKSKRVHRAELKHIRWENFPLEAIMRGRNPTALSTSPKKGSAMTNMTAWKQGNCLIIYPEHTGSTTTSSSDNTSSTIEFESEKAAITAMSSESTRLRHLREEKLAVVALFDALEPLAQALMIGRT